MADEQEQNTENEGTSTQTDGKVTLTQEKLDGLINSKFAAGAEKATKELLANIGVDDITILKGIVSNHKEQQEANKTELQKLQEQLEVERMAKVELEMKLVNTQTETEIQNIAMANGINPNKIKYFKIDFLEAKQSEGFNAEEFIENLKKTQPDFFGFIDERRPPVNVPNPQGSKTPSSSIKMIDYARLPAEERKKYKSTDIIR